MMYSPFVNQIVSLQSDNARLEAFNKIVQEAANEVSEINDKLTEMNEAHVKEIVELRSRNLALEQLLEIEKKEKMQIFNHAIKLAKQIIDLKRELFASQAELGLAVGKKGMV